MTGNEKTGSFFLLKCKEIINLVVRHWWSM